MSVPFSECVEVAARPCCAVNSLLPSAPFLQNSVDSLLTITDFLPFPSKRLLHVGFRMESLPSGRERQGSIPPELHTPDGVQDVCLSIFQRMEIKKVLRGLCWWRVRWLLKRDTNGQSKEEGEFKATTNSRLEQPQFLVPGGRLVLVTRWGTSQACAMTDLRLLCSSDAGALWPASTSPKNSVFENARRRSARLLSLHERLLRL